MSRQQSYSEAVKVKPGQSAYHGDVLLKPEKIPSDAKEGTSPDVLGWGEWQERLTVSLRVNSSSIKQNRRNISERLPIS